MADFNSSIDEGTPSWARSSNKGLDSTLARQAPLRGSKSSSGLSDAFNYMNNATTQAREQVHHVVIRFGNWFSFDLGELANPQEWDPEIT